jgi:iron(III) transport system permease protein
MALPATLLGAAWAVGIARAEVLGPRVARPWARFAGSLPWAIPATALAMAWLAAFNQPNVAGLGLALASTPFLLPVAYCLRFVPLQVRAAAAVLQSRGTLLEQTARTLGAGPWRAAWSVTLPVLRPALIGSSALVFVLATGEFVVSILLYVPENRPISLEILSELRLFNLGRAAALGTWLSVLLGAVLLLVPRSAMSWNESSSRSR